MNVLVLLGLILVGLQTQASGSRPSGYERGNGGHFISCSKESSLGEGIYSLDRVEGEALFQMFAPAALKNSQDEVQIVDFVLNQLHQVNPTRAKLYRMWLQELLTNRVFSTDLYFEPIQDGNTVAVPRGCELRQAAIFITEPSRPSVRFLFDKVLWQNASAVDRAYLLVHELIYREALLPENRHSNSMAARYLNAWIFANVEKYDSVEMLNVLMDLQFHAGDYSGIPLTLSTFVSETKQMSAPILFYENSRSIHKAVLGYSFSLQIEGKNFARSCDIPALLRGFQNIVEFYPSGKVKRLAFAEPFEFGLPTNRPPSSECVFFEGSNDLSFTEDGVLVEKKTVPGLPVYSSF